MVILVLTSMVLTEQIVSRRLLRPCRGLQSRFGLGWWTSLHIGSACKEWKYYLVHARTYIDVHLIDGSPSACKLQRVEILPVHARTYIDVHLKDGAARIFKNKNDLPRVLSFQMT